MKLINTQLSLQFAETQRQGGNISRETLKHCLNGASGTLRQHTPIIMDLKRSLKCILPLLPSGWIVFILLWMKHKTKHSGHVARRETK